MCPPMPDDDPTTEVDIPGPCWRWPTCDDVIGEDTCTWPACSPEPPTPTERLLP